MKRVDPKLVLTNDHLSNGTLFPLKRSGVYTIGMVQLMSKEELLDIRNFGPLKLRELDMCLASFHANLRYRKNNEDRVKRARQIFTDLGAVPIAYMYHQGLIDYTALLHLESARDGMRVATYGELTNWRESDLAAMRQHNNQPYFDTKMLARMREELKRYSLSFR